MTPTDFLFYSGCAFLLCSSGCGEGAPSFQLRLDQKTAIRESEFVLHHHPASICFTGDSTACLFSTHSIAEYNIYSGDLIQRFDGKTINWDSIVLKNYGTNAEGKLYLPCHGKFNDPDIDAVNGSHISSFHFDGTRYWVFFDAQSTYTYTDSTTRHEAMLAMLESDPTGKLADLLRRKPDLKSKVSELKTFLLRLDKKFNVESIVPLNENRMPSGENGRYLVMPSKGFTTDGNKIFLFATDVSIYPSDTVFFNDSDRVSFVAQMDCSGDSLRFEKILTANTSKNIPVHLLSYSAYYDNGLRFDRDSGQLIVNFGAGFWNVSSNHPYSLQPAEDLRKTEVYDFAFGTNDYCYLSVSHDSARSVKRVCQLRFLDRKTHQLLASEPAGVAPSFARRGDKILNVRRENEHYYFRIYSVHYSL